MRKQSNLQHRHVQTENLVGVEKDCQRIKLNKSVYMGMSTLDYSKVHMYSFTMDAPKPKYNDNIKLVYTATVSYVKD